MSLNKYSNLYGYQQLTFHRNRMKKSEKQIAKMNLTDVPASSFDSKLQQNYLRYKLENHGCCSHEVT